MPTSQTRLREINAVLITALIEIAPASEMEHSTADVTPHQDTMQLIQSGHDLISSILVKEQLPDEYIKQTSISLEYFFKTSLQLLSTLESEFIIIGDTGYNGLQKDTPGIDDSDETDILISTTHCPLGEKLKLALSIAEIDDRYPISPVPLAVRALFLEEKNNVLRKERDHYKNEVRTINQELCETKAKYGRTQSGPLSLKMF